MATFTRFMTVTGAESCMKQPDDESKTKNGRQAGGAATSLRATPYGMSAQSRNRLMTTRMLELPHFPDGEIDYNTLGNMMVATLMGEVLHVSYVDHEFGSKWSGGGPKAATDWQFYYKEHGVVIFRKKLPNTRIDCFMGRGVVDAPLNEVAEYINRFQTRFEWDNLLVKLEVCKRFSENDWLIYLAHEATQCLIKQKRDLLYHCRTAYVDEKYVQASVSVEHPDYPERPPYIRSEVRPGTGWVLEKYDGSECSTLISYLAHLDLKNLPPIIVNRVMRRQPLAIHYISRKLSSPAKFFTSSFPSSLGSSLDSLTVHRHSPDTYEEFSPVSHDMNRTESYRVRRHREAKGRSDSPREVYPWVENTRKGPRSATISVSAEHQVATSSGASNGLSNGASPGHALSTSASQEGEQYSREAQTHGPLLVQAPAEPGTHSGPFTFSLP